VHDSGPNRNATVNGARAAFARTTENTASVTTAAAIATTTGVGVLR